MMANQNTEQQVYSCTESQWFLNMYVYVYVYMSL